MWAAIFRLQPFLLAEVHIQHSVTDMAVDKQHCFFQRDFMTQDFTIFNTIQVCYGVAYHYSP